MESVHKTVLLNETIDGLNLHDGAIVVDATFGGGGHSREICRRCKGVKIIAIDQDNSAWEKAKSKFEDCVCDIKFVNKNFSEIENLEKVDGIIFDLGLSSDQLENSGRGFSFMKNEPLLMTMKEPARDASQSDAGGNPSEYMLTAREIVNGWSEKSLADIIYGYGEEKYRGRIAREIVESRKKKKIEMTFDLVSIIENAVPGSYRKGKIHCATRTFQALRIAVNDELGALEKGLDQGFKILKSGGRMSVISFHSLEDRIVKKFYKEKEKIGEAIIINKKVILPSIDELKTNNRSRSAKLRIIEKI